MNNILLDVRRWYHHVVTEKMPSLKNVPTSPAERRWMSKQSRSQQWYTNNDSYDVTAWHIDDVELYRKYWPLATREGNENQQIEQESSEAWEQKGEEIM